MGALSFAKSLREGSANKRSAVAFDFQPLLNLPARSKVGLKRVYSAVCVRIKNSELENDCNVHMGSFLHFQRSAHSVYLELSWKCRDHMIH